MFSDILTEVRSQALAALPPGVYASDRILFDALDKDITPTDLRTVNITTQLGASTLASVGRPKRYRTVGVLYIRLYEPSGKGDGHQLIHASTICDALRGLSTEKGDTKILFRAPTLANAPREGGMWVRVVQVDFRADTFV